MDEVAGSGNDEFYTPLYAVKPIFKYVKPNSKIWCPFDSDKSWFVKYGKSLGHTILHSHLDNGEDFFNTYFRVSYLIILNKSQIKKERFYPLPIYPDNRCHYTNFKSYLSIPPLGSLSTEYPWNVRSSLRLSLSL